MTALRALLPAAEQPEKVSSFAYKGVSAEGRSVSGVVEAESPRSARARLRERGIFAHDLREGSHARTAAAAGARLLVRRVPVRELARTLRQLATLIGAGIPLVDAIASLRNRPLRARMAAALDAMRTDVTAGASFHAAAAKHPDVVPPIYTGMIRAGEASGALDRVLGRIADHAESTARLQGQLRSAMTYPLIMMLVGGGIVTFLLAYVVPQVTRVFVESKQALPLPTRALMGLGRFVASYGLWVLAFAAAAALAVRMYATTARGRRAYERVAFRVPWIGAVLRNVVMARFAHTLSTLLAGGLPLIEGLEISRGAAGSALVADAVDAARQAVSEGQSLGACLGRSPLFNPMVVDMIAVGERSGVLERMLGRAADALDEEVRGSVETMASVLEPAMILLMAGVVLFVVLAVLLPVFEMNQLVR
jgi:general secretion pathway protein F